MALAFMVVNKSVYHRGVPEYLAITFLGGGESLCFKTLWLKFDAFTLRRQWRCYQESLLFPPRTISALTNLHSHCSLFVRQKLLNPSSINSFHRVMVNEKWVDAADIDVQRFGEAVLSEAVVLLAASAHDTLSSFEVMSLSEAIRSGIVRSWLVHHRISCDWKHVVLL